jgi:hypothetical protein
MRHPSERFITSLLVQSKNDDEIKEAVLSYGLPPLTEAHTDYLVRLRLDVIPKIPSGYTGFQEDDRAFLKAAGIEGLVHPDSVSISILSILQMPFTRRDALLGILGRVDVEDLAEHLGNKLGAAINASHVNALKHYYYDVDMLSPDQWFDVFGAIPNEIESQLYHSCLVGGPIVAAYKLGLDRHVTVKEAVQEVVSALYTTLYEIKDWPASPAKIKLLSDTMGSLAKAHGVLSTSDQELAAVASELRTFKLARSTTKPTPFALLKGKIN